MKKIFLVPILALLSVFFFILPTYGEEAVALGVYETDEGKWGIIEADGKFIVQPKYDAMWVFIEDALIVVSYEGRLGIIDPFGKEITPCLYTDITYRGFSLRPPHLDILRPQSAFVITNPPSGFMEDWILFEEGYVIAAREDTWVAVNRAGKEITPMSEEGAEWISNGNGKTIYGDDLYEKGIKMIPLIQTTNRVSLSSDSIGETAYNGLLAFGVKIEGTPPKLPQGEANSGTFWGFVDIESGNVVIEPQFSSVYGFNEGFAFVELNNSFHGVGLKDQSWAVIDTSGKVTVKEIDGYPRWKPHTYTLDKFQAAGFRMFSEGLATVGLERKKDYAIDHWTPMVIDTKGNVVIAPFTDMDVIVIYPFINGTALARVSIAPGESRYGFINTKGEFVISHKYYIAGNTSPFSKPNGINNNRLHPTAILQNGYYQVMTDGSGTKNGLVSTEGVEIIPPIFNYASVELLDGVPVYIVVSDAQRRYGAFDLQGAEILPPIYSADEVRAKMAEILATKQK